MQATTVASILTSGAAGPDLGSYFSSVGIMLGVLLVLAWGIKRLAGRGRGLRGTKRGLQIVEVLSLGGRRQLAVVRCYDRTFALGLGEKDVSLVAELDPVEVPAPAGTEDPTGDPSLESPKGPDEIQITLQPQAGEQAAGDPFTELIERAQERIASSGQLERPPVTSVKEWKQ